MTKPIISVENLSKAYRLGLKEEVPDSLVSAVVGIAKAPFKNFRKLSRLDAGAGGDEEDILWALKDVSFDVHEGEVVGIIGRNGAGKSTLLKILSRITEPTSGCVKLRGRVSSLLEVGTGFHPELTGRDNIYMNGTILGMMKKEIDQKFDEIVDFSGVEKFLDTPVKRYSSGMLVRLAFSVAAHLEPEILIVDEVLAVGDAEFQKKCLGKMQDVSSSGRTVLFVSHNMAAVQTLCTHGICLLSGKIESMGSAAEAMDCYLNSSVSSLTAKVDLSNHPGRTGGTTSYLNQVTILDGHGDFSRQFLPRESFSIDVLIDNLEFLRNPALHIAFFDSSGYRVATSGTDLCGFKMESLAGESVFSFLIETPPFRPGRYFLTLAVCDTSSNTWVETIHNAIHIEVEPDATVGTRLRTGNFGPIELDYRCTQR